MLREITVRCEKHNISYIPVSLNDEHPDAYVGGIVYCICPDYFCRVPMPMEDLAISKGGIYTIPYDAIPDIPIIQEEDE